MALVSVFKIARGTRRVTFEFPNTNKVYVRIHVDLSNNHMTNFLAGYQV